MDSSVSLKDEIWFLRVCHHISTVLYERFGDICCLHLQVMAKLKQSKQVHPKGDLWLLRRWKWDNRSSVVLRSVHWIRHTIRHNEFASNILEGAIFEKKAVGRPWLQYLNQVARNSGVDGYTAMERVACNNSKWIAANRSKDWRRRRHR